MLQSSSHSHRIRDAIVGVTLTFATVLVVLGIIEGGFYAYAWRHPSTERGFFWEPNAQYGWGLIPGRVGPYYDANNEFMTHIRINSKGLRDVEHAYDKPLGVYRVLILGDSYMESMQVEQDEMFARLLESELNTRDGNRVEVINTGVSSWGTDNELLFFRSEGYRYHPDLVLLVFTTANDIRENYEPYDREQLDANLAKPSFSLNADGTLRITPGPPLPPSIPWWRKHFYLGQWLYIRLGGTVLLPTGNKYGIAPPLDPKIPYVAPDLFIYAPEYRPEVAEAWQVTKALLVELQREVAKHGAKFGIVVNNGPWAHYRDRWEFMTMRHPIARDTWDPTKPTRTIDAFLSEQHIPFMDLFDTFEREKGREQLYFKFDPHWRPAGHRLAAAAAADFLRREGLVPNASAR